MNEFLNAFLIEIIAVLGTLVGAAVAYYIRKFIARISKSYDIDDTKELAMSVVRFVEQVYGQVDGNEKFKIAKQRLIDLANEKGINITEKQVETFIEEAVRGFKDEYGEDWAERFKNV